MHKYATSYRLYPEANSDTHTTNFSNGTHTYTGVHICSNMFTHQIYTS